MLVIFFIMLSIPKFKVKEKVTVFIVILFLLGSVYFYLNHLQQSYNSVQWSGERCLSELTSIKYQLTVVTEYKNRIDKLLTETQKAHDIEKEKYKDVMDSCVAMKQQTAICQSQFEDLQIECKKVREDYNKAIKELEKMKLAGLEQYDKNFNFLTPQLSQISVPVIILPPDEPFHDIKSDAILNLQ